MTDEHVLTVLVARRKIDLFAGLALLLGVGLLAADRGVGGALGLGFCVVLAGLCLAVPRRSRTSLRGTVLVRRGLFRTRELDLRTADRVEVGGNGVGIAALSAWGPGGRNGHGVLALNAYLRQGSPPQDLLALAAALGERPPAATAVALLRAQAAHLSAGGALETSPMAPLAGKQVAGNLGRAGAAGSLLDP